MKRYFFLPFMIVLIFSIIRCDLDKNPISSYSSKYEGKWRWIKTVGGFAPIVITPDEGTTVIIKYDNKNTFKLFRNDTLKVSAKYNIEQTDYYRDKILYLNIVTYDYHFNRDYEYVYLSGDTLDIWDGAMDGFFSWYIKE